MVIGMLLLLVMILVGILIIKREPKENDFDEVYYADVSLHQKQTIVEATYPEEEVIYETI
jgi:hypothetical protein